MVLTAIGMSGLLTATPTSAAASAGDLIKMAGNTSVYYLGSDGKRYVFPNSTTYFSWYTDFSGVITIPAAELQSYPLGGNVTMRAGTQMVKITTDPSVYAVEPNGTLRKIQSEAQAAALYGTNWNKRIVDVPDAFFVNYTIGSVLPTGAVPAGSLVKNAGAPDVYYFDGTNYRMITSEYAFLANRFQWSNIITASSTVSAGGTAISGAEASLVNVAQNGGQGPIVTGSGLMVSLSSQTPAATSIPKNGVRVPFAKLNLTAANDGSVSVNQIVVKRIGLSSHNDVSQVWAEQNGAIVASKKSMNSNDESILVFSPALVVPAGQTVSIDLLASLSGSGSGNIGLGVVSASAVSSTAASVTGSFPINGNLMSLIDYNVAKLAIPTVSSATSTVKVGDEKVELGRFEVGFNTNGVTAKDVTLQSITLKNNGVENLSTAAMNLYLEHAGNKVSSSYSVNGRFVTFYFAGGLDLLKDDSSKLFYIKGDIIAKENTAANSFSFVLDKSTDLNAYEKATGFGVNVYTTNSGTTLANNYAISNVTIDAGIVAISKKSTSPSDTTIVKGSDHTVLIANIRADERINVDGLNLVYGSNGSNATTTNQFENVRVYVNGVLIDSFDPSFSTTTTLTAVADSTFTLNKGDNEVRVMARAKTTAPAGSAFMATLNSSAFTGMNPEYVVSGNAVASGDITGTATGAIFTVEGAALTTVRSDGYATNRPIVQGSNNVSLGKFTVKASNDVVTVTSVSFGANASTTPASSISDMKLYVDGAMVGNAVNFGSSGATFSSLNFTIAKDSTRTLELFGSFDSSATGGFQTTMTVNAQDSRGTVISTGNTATTTMFSVVASGSLVVEAGGDTPVDGLLVAKSNEQEVAQFKFTAINDSANLTEINVVNYAGGSVSSAADARIAAVRLYDGGTLIDQFVPVNGAGKFTINNNSVIVPANGSKTLSVRVSLNNIENDASATNKDLTVRVTTAKFKSSAGSESTHTANKSANDFRIRKTVPTIGFQSLPETLLTAGDKVIARFTVSADANADVTVGRFALTVATTSNATATAIANPLRVNGSNKAATATVAGGKMTILLDTPEIVAAGTSKTFEVLASLTVSGSSSESVTAKIVEDASYSTDSDLASVTGDFAWSDGASITEYTWANGHNVPGLDTMTWVISKN